MKMPLTFWILQQNPEASRHRFFRRSAADIQEVRRLAACQLDDVHRRHREARAVHHAADVAVELHVVQIIFPASISSGSSSFRSRMF